MFNWFKKTLRAKQSRRQPHEQQEEYVRRNPLAKLPPVREDEPSSSGLRLRAVPGALVAKAHNGQVLYNMLTPHMGQFMGRCVGAIKRAGIVAKGTGQFSILVGEQERELRLDRFYQPTDDPAILEQVVALARRMTNAA